MWIPGAERRTLSAAKLELESSTVSTSNDLELHSFAGRLQRIEQLTGARLTGRQRREHVDMVAGRSHSAGDPRPIRTQLLGVGADEYRPAMTARHERDALLTLAFALHSNPGAYALLLGAGVSAPSVKTAWGVLEDLCAKVALLEGATDVDDPVVWFEREFGEPARYGPLLEKVAPTPTERQALLADYFVATDEDRANGRKVPTPAHRAIAQLVVTGTVRVIVTLNFDRLIEQAIRDVGLEPTVIASAADVAGMAPLHTIEACVIHLHGDYMSPASMLNTDSELGSYNGRVAALLQRVLEEYGLVIAGWSAKHDTALREAVAEHHSRRYTLTWIEPFEPTAEAAALRALKDGRLMSTDADSAFGQIADAVASLRTREGHHPLTVPVAVESAKRELSGGNVAISIHDLLGTAFADLHAHRDFHLDNYQSADPYGGYPAMAARTREAARLPSALVATLAYWGTAATDQWWLDELPRFATQPFVSGSSAVIELRHIAGISLFYAAGVSATAGRRWGLLANMFGLTAADPYSWGRRRLTRLFAPDSAYSHLAGAGTHLFPDVGALLVEVLGIGAVALEEAWQTFEVLRLAAELAHDLEGSTTLRDLDTASAAMQLAAGTIATVRRAGDPTSAAESELRHASASYDALVVQASDRIVPGQVHVLSVDRRRNESPTAETLADSVQAEGDDHPLIRGGLFSSSVHGAYVLRVVSVTVGKAGDHKSWRIAKDGTIPRAVWLDNDETPDRMQ